VGWLLALNVDFLTNTGQKAPVFPLVLVNYEQKRQKNPKGGIAKGDISTGR